MGILTDIFMVKDEIHRHIKELTLSESRKGKLE